MNDSFEIWRDRNGVPHVEGQEANAMYRGQGYVHARDRGMQILLMRIVGQGRVSEILDSSDNSLKTDIFFRRMNWSANADHLINALSTDARAALDAYCAGVNQGFHEKTPFEFKLFGYQPEPWTPADCFLLLRMGGYLTLAQSQQDIQRLLIEMVQAGVSDEKLEALFPGLLGGLDRNLINRIALEERIVPNEVLWGAGAPRMMASNNWVLSGRKTASGKPILANDPHLEVNRLPNVWSEMAISCGGKWAIGGTIPGLPGILIGRNNNLAWGVTYAFIDAIDAWIEKCRDGKYYREESDNWRDFTTRKEAIKRKNKEAVSVVFYENELGLLDGEPVGDGYRLVTKWAAADAGAASMNAAIALFGASTVKEGMHILAEVETGWNYVFADSYGNIGYQMTGRVPIRRESVSGFVPLPGWKKKNHWRGFVTPDAMPYCYNPDEGFICTANNDLNRFGTASPINISMGAYRAERIEELLTARDNFDVHDMQQIQFDVFSRQADAFMKILRPLLPNTPQGDLLSRWDCRYDADSEGAYLFEKFYKALFERVFGHNGLSSDVVNFLQRETGVFTDFYANFDRVLLSAKSPWFDGEPRDAIYKAVAKEALATDINPWKNAQQFQMTNILFAGKLPAFLKFDRGPVTAIGGRATIHQGQIYRSTGRDTTFLPSIRIVADLSDGILHTNIAGGPSDRRFSKWYCNELENWASGKYKRISVDKNQPRSKF